MLPSEKTLISKCKWEGFFWRFYRNMRPIFHHSFYWMILLRLLRKSYAEFYGSFHKVMKLQHHWVWGKHVIPVNIQNISPLDFLAYLRERTFYKVLWCFEHTSRTCEILSFEWSQRKWHHPRGWTYNMLIVAYIKTFGIFGYFIFLHNEKGSF